MQKTRKVIFTIKQRKLQYLGHAMRNVFSSTIEGKRSKEKEVPEYEEYPGFGI